jgi:hypothetical protein
VLTRIQILDYPVGGIGAILTMLSQPGDFHPRTGHESWSMGTLTRGQKTLYPLYRRQGGPQYQSLYQRHEDGGIEV